MLQGKACDIKQDTPYTKSQHKAVERFYYITLNLFDNHHLIEKREVAVEPTGVVNLGSPREKSGTGTAVVVPERVKHF